MSTYLVTGAAGFIASKVAEMLLADGHTVVGVDNLNDYYDVRLKYYRLARLAELAGCDASQVASLKEQVTRSGPQLSAFSSQLSPVKSDRFEFHTLDIEDLPALERVFERSDFAAVFNLAARAGVRYSLEFPELYRRTNVLGEENVLKCQVKYGVKKHVLASSSSVYAGCPMPFVEDAVLGKMQSPYAETKRQAELLALDYHQKHGIDVTALRYFTVFGPAGRPDMAPFRFIKWIDEGTPITLYGDGTQARDFTYVDDIARGTILAGRLVGGRMTDDGRLTPISDLQAPISNIQTPISDLRSPNSEFQTPGFEIINLGGGNNPISLHTMIGWIEAALNAQRRGKAETGRRLGADGEAKLKAEGSDKSADPESNPQVSLLAIDQATAEAFSASVSPGENRGQTPGGQQPATASSQLSVKARIAAQPSSPADMKATWADISKAGRLLGWKPETSPVDGFQKTVQWYTENRDLVREIKV